MVTKAKTEIKNNVEEEIQIKMKTTKQILKGLDTCFGITKRSKEVIKMYSDYIKLYKNKKIKIGNLNIILNCNSNNYSNIINVINSILFKEGIIQYTQYELLTDVHFSKNYNLNTNCLYVVNDDSLRDYKLEKFVANNPTSVFIVICNDNNLKMIDNIRTKFTWEISVKEPSVEEKIQYIKDTIVQHGLIPRVTSAELEAITCYDLPTIDSFLITAIIGATKKKLTYISKEELNIIENPNHNLGMKKLNNLVGLADVKEQVQQILNYVKVHKERGSLHTLNMVFKGNPGTGKTEVARIIAEIFADNEILEGNFVEVGRNDLVAGYVGQTAIKTQKVIESALGGVLFIDEAYSLLSDDNYSKECISTLIKAMEDHRNDLSVIMARLSTRNGRVVEI